MNDWSKWASAMLAMFLVFSAPPASASEVIAPRASAVVVVPVADTDHTSADIVVVAPVSSAGLDRQDDFARRFIRRIDGDARVFGYRALRAALSAVGDDDASWDEEMSDLGDATADKLFQAAADSATDGLRRSLEGSFIRNLTLSYQSPFSSSGARVSGDALAGLWGDADKLLFAQFGGGADFGDDGEDDDSDKYGSVGFGLRGKLGGAVLGGNIFGDVTAEGYRRHSFGLEARHRGGSLRANWYFGDAHLADGRTLEASGRVPGLTDWAEFGAEFSQWDNTADDGGDEMEAGYRLSVFPRDGVRLNFKQNKEEGESSSFEVLAEFGWHLDATGLAGAAIRLGDASQLEARLDGIVERDREFRKKTKLAPPSEGLASAASASGQVGPDCGSGTADGDSCVVSGVASSLGALVVTLYADGSCETEIDGEAAVSRRGRLLADGVNVCESAATAAEIDWSPGFGFGNATAEPRILTGTAGEAFSHNLADDFDAEGDLTCEVAAGALPAGLVLDGTACGLSGTFPAAAGLLSFTIRADDGAGDAYTAAYALNRHPVGEATMDAKAVQGRLFRRDVATDFSDADGDFLICALKDGSLLPAWMLRDGLGGCILTGTPLATESAVLTLVVEDGVGGRAEAEYTINVIAAAAVESAEIALREAAEDGDVAEVARLLAEGDADVNAESGGYYGYTALMAAARYGRAEVVEKLLAATGVNVNLQNNYGDTALIRAAQYGHAEVVEKLLAATGVNVNLQNNSGYTALIRAARYDSAEVVEKLLAVTGVNVNLQNNSGYTALIWAARYDSAEVVEKLLAVTGVNVNLQNNSGDTALDWANTNANPSIREKLVAEGGICNQVCSNPAEIALIVAAKDGNAAEVARLLAMENLNVNAKDSSGLTALIWAARYDHAEVVEKLLAVTGVNVNLQNNSGYTALIWAARYDSAEVVEKLLAVTGVNVNLQNNSGDTALIVAARYGRAEVVEKLLAVTGVNINLQNNSGYTALIWAARYDHAEVVEKLLAVTGVNVNLQNNSGYTALDFAKTHADQSIHDRLVAAGGQCNNLCGFGGAEAALIAAARDGNAAEVARLLAASNLNVNVKDLYGYTALMRAAESGHAEIVRALLATPGIQVNLRNNPAHAGRRTALMLGIRHAEVVRALLAAPGIQVNLQDDYGYAALNLAALRNNETSLDMLLAAPGINVNTPNRDGNTALIEASRHNHPSIVQKLVAMPGIEVNIVSDQNKTALDNANIHNMVSARVRLLVVGARCRLECRLGDINLRAPAALAGLTAMPEDSGMAGDVVLQWTASADATGYNIYRDGVKIAEIDGDETAPYTDADVGGGTYAYTMEAVNTHGASERSAAVSALVPNDAPVAVPEALRDFPVLLNKGFARDLAADFSDPDGDALICSVKAGGSGLPSGLRLSGAGSCELSGTPRSAGSSAAFTIVVADGNGGISEAGYTIRVMSAAMAEEKFRDAAENGDADEAENLLRALGSDIDVNAHDFYGNTALILAVLNGHDDVVEVLLLNAPDIDVNLSDDYGETALTWAAYYGDDEMVETLLGAERINVNLQNDFGETALIAAATNDHLETVKALLKVVGVRVNLKDDYGNTALIWAAQNGAADVAKALLDANGIDVNAVDSDGNTALIWAAASGYINVIEELLNANGIDVNAVDSDGNTALIWAAQNGDADAVAALLDDDEINAGLEDNNGNTALTWALRLGYGQVVALLTAAAASA